MFYTWYYWVVNYDSSLTNYWPINNDLIDLIGGATFTSTTPGWSLNRFNTSGGASRVNSVSNYLKLPSGVYFTGDMTFMGWVYMFTCSGYMRYLDCGVGTSYTVMLSLSGSVCYPYINFGSNKPVSVSWSTGKWHHAAMTVSGTTAQFYMNGVSSLTTSVTPPANVTRTSCYIGKSNWNDPYANASFDEIKIYNRALSAAEILADLNLGTQLVDQVSSTVATYKQ